MEKKRTREAMQTAFNIIRITADSAGDTVDDYEALSIIKQQIAIIERLQLRMGSTSIPPIPAHVGKGKN